MGSWKIMAISAPRIARYSAPSCSSSSKLTTFPDFVRYNISPKAVQLSGLMPMTALLVTLFPHPDSPTSPSVSPLPMEKFTPRTALRVWSSILMSTRRSRTSRMRPGSMVYSRGADRFLFRFISPHLPYLYGSAASRRPSPMKLKARTVRKTNSMGISRQP